MMQLWIILFKLSWCWNSGMCNRIAAIREAGSIGSSRRSGWILQMVFLHPFGGTSVAKDERRLGLFDGASKIFFKGTSQSGNNFFEFITE